MPRPRKARADGIADPVPGNNGEALERIVEFFKAEHPEEWEAMQLSPLAYGLAAMIAQLG